MHFSPAALLLLLVPAIRSAAIPNQGGISVGNDSPINKGDLPNAVANGILGPATAKRDEAANLLAPISNTAYPNLSLEEVKKMVDSITESTGAKNVRRDGELVAGGVEVQGTAGGEAELAAADGESVVLDVVSEFESQTPNARRDTTGKDGDAANVVGSTAGIVAGVAGVAGRQSVGAGAGGLVGIDSILEIVTQLLEQIMGLLGGLGGAGCKDCKEGEGGCVGRDCEETPEGCEGEDCDETPQEVAGQDPEEPAQVDESTAGLAGDSDENR